MPRLETPFFQTAVKVTVASGLRLLWFSEFKMFYFHPLVKGFKVAKWVLTVSKNLLIWIEKFRPHHSLASTQSNIRSKRRAAAVIVVAPSQPVIPPVTCSVIREFDPKL